MNNQDPIRVGVVGCSEGTHGKVWAEMLATPSGAAYGMRPTKVWDRSPEAAQVVAKSTGARSVASAADCGEDVDGVLITELLPDRYLELARPFLEAGRRVFFNRPFAGSVKDAAAITETARKCGAKVYSASALYHTQAGPKLREESERLRPVRLFNVTGPTDHLGFYLPHAVAAVMSVLGSGIETVRTASLHRAPEDEQHATTPVVAYVEYGSAASAGSARGTIQMLGPAATWYGFVVKLFGAAAETAEVHLDVQYDLLLRKMAEFFRTGEEPVPHSVLVEKTAVYYAILESAKRGGASINVPRMIARASGR